MGNRIIRLKPLKNRLQYAISHPANVEHSTRTYCRNMYIVQESTDEYDLVRVFHFPLYLGSAQCPTLTAVRRHPLCPAPVADSDVAKVLCSTNIHISQESLRPEVTSGGQEP